MCLTNILNKFIMEFNPFFFWIETECFMLNYFRRSQEKKKKDRRIGLYCSPAALICWVFCKWVTEKDDVQFEEGNSQYAELIFHCLHIKSLLQLNSSCPDTRRRQSLFKPLAPDCISLFSMTVETPIFPSIDLEIHCSETVKYAKWSCTEKDRCTFNQDTATKAICPSEKSFPAECNAQATLPPASQFNEL